MADSRIRGRTAGRLSAGTTFLYASVPTVLQVKEIGALVFAAAMNMGMWISPCLQQFGPGRHSPFFALADTCMMVVQYPVLTSIAARLLQVVVHGSVADRLSFISATTDFGESLETDFDAKKCLDRRARHATTPPLTRTWPAFVSHEQASVDLLSVTQPTGDLLAVCLSPSCAFFSLCVSLRHSVPLSQ